MFIVLSKIAIIIFMVEGFIMVAFDDLINRLPILWLSVLNPVSLALLSFLPIYYWTIRPYVLSRNESERVLANESAEKAAIVENIREGIICINGKGIIKAYNSSAEKLFGYSKDAILGQNVNMLMVKGDDKSRHDSYVSNYSKTGVSNIMGVGRETCGKRKDGTEFPMHLAVNKIKISDNHMFVGVIRDLTEQKLQTSLLTQQISELDSQHRKINQKHQLLQKIMDNTRQGIVVFDCQLRLLAWNTVFLSLMKLDGSGYYEGMSIKDFFQLNLKKEDKYKQTIAEYITDLRKKIENRTDRNEFCQDKLRPDGSILHSIKIIMQDGTVINSYRDVTAERKEEKRIKAIALCDGLTDLGNRRAFNAQLERVIEAYKQSNIPFVLVYIDLDNFKLVNDTHGHGVGDSALKFVSENIKKHIRTSDIAVRFGGDEFAIIYNGVKVTDTIMDRIGNIISATKGKKSIDNAPLEIGISVGVACCPDDGTNIKTLMEAADTALYIAKRKGKGNVYYKERS